MYYFISKINVALFKRLVSVEYQRKQSHNAIWIIFAMAQILLLRLATRILSSIEAATLIPLINNINNEEKRNGPRGLYKILIVDDQITILEAFKLILSKQYFTQYAGNGKHALNILKQQTFDLLITGIRMPTMDGIALLGNIQGKYPKMKRIVVTALKAEEVERRAKELGAIEYILKPFDVQPMLDVIEKLRQ